MKTVAVPKKTIAAPTGALGAAMATARRSAEPCRPVFGDVVLAPDGHLEGVVVNTDGVPVASVRVTVTPAGRVGPVRRPFQADPPDPEPFQADRASVPPAGQTGGRPIQVQTDGLGRFRALVGQGGVYQVSVGPHRCLVRAWAAGTAPPTAKPWVLVVAGGDVVRGQMPLEEFASSNAFVVSAMVAAMIAIPVSVRNSGGGQPASP